MTADLIFDLHKIKFHCHNQLDLNGLLLLAALPKHSGNPYEQCGISTEPQPALG